MVAFVNTAMEKYNFTTDTKNDFAVLEFQRYFGNKDLTLPPPPQTWLLHCHRSLFWTSMKIKSYPSLLKKKTVTLKLLGNF